MKTRNIIFYICEVCGRESESGGEIEQCEQKHKDRNECLHDNIEYMDTYEMRSRDMYCKDCGKMGSRDELQPKK